MNVVEVEYDGSWFTRINGRFVEAKTIRKLLEKLGAGFSVVGYFPEGYVETPKERPEQVFTPKTLATAAAVKEGKLHYEAPPKIEKPPEPEYKREPSGYDKRTRALPWTKEENEEFKRLIEANVGPQVIAEKLSKTYSAIIGKMHRDKIDERRKSQEAGTEVLSGSAPSTD